MGGIRLSTLLRRCEEFIDRPGDAGARDLADFVLSEIGRTADKSLEDAQPLVLYFANEEDRKAIVDLFLALKPDMRRWP
jgi:uncharacterized protein (DUF1778 family)